MRAELLALVCLACGSKPAVSPETLAKCEASATFFEQMAGQVIDSGLCDAIEHVEDCAPYAAVELAYEQSQRSQGCPSKLP